MSGWQLPAETSRHRDPRRVGLAAAAVVIGYAVFIGAIRAGFIRVAGSGGGDIGPSDADLGALWLTVAFALPGVIAGIAAARRSGPLLVTAGVLCLAQAFVAFSGIALPFVVPGIYLIALGARTAPGRDGHRATLAGLGVIVLVLAGWVAGLGLTETRCWVATLGPDGTYVYADVPATDEMLYGRIGRRRFGRRRERHPDAGRLRLRRRVAHGRRCRSWLPFRGGGRCADRLGLEIRRRRGERDRSYVSGSGTNGPSAFATATNSGRP